MKMKFQIFFSVVLMSLIQTSCIFGVDTALPECNPGESLILNLNLSVPSSVLGSRSGGHGNDRGIGGESYIDLDNSDYRLYVFDKEGKLSNNLTDVVCTSNGEAGGIISYTISAILKFADESEMEQLSTFRVMVLANWMAFHKNTAVTHYPSLSGYDIVSDDSKNLFKNGTDFNFTFPELESSPWKPGPETGRYIPMFGTSDKLDLEDAMDKTKYGNGFEIPMLRSIAKVEIVDQTSHHPITNVTLSHKIPTGRFIPDIEANTDWSASAQITIPSIPDDFSMKEGSQIFSSAHENDDEATVWSLYLPEIDFTTLPAKDHRPVVQIVYNKKTYAFELDNNVEKASQNVSSPARGDGSLDYVLRNHIYRYAVTENGADLQVGLNVLPWDMEWENDEWHFDLPTVKLPDNFDENNPRYPYHLKWTTQKEDPDHPGDMIDNGYIDMENSLQLFMKASTDDYAEGKFTLAAPLKATWYAVLVPLQGEHDAFEFYNDGTRTWDHGIIDGNEAVIKIRNTREIVNNERNEARLEIMVEYPDKTQKQAFVVNPSLSGNNYTIVQQKTSLD